MKMRVESPVETLVGAVVIAVAVGFALFASSSVGDNAAKGDGGYQVFALFSSANGVKVGSDVRIAGVKVGRVSSVALDAETMAARVEMAIQNGVELPDETFATVDAEGLLGGVYISLDPIPGIETLGDGGQIVNTQGAVSLSGLISRFVAGGGSDTGVEAANGAAQ